MAVAAAAARAERKGPEKRMTVSLNIHATLVSGGEDRGACRTS